MTEAAWEREGPAVRDAPGTPTASRERIAAPPTGWRVADALLAVVLLISLIVGSNLDRMPEGLAEFLAIRISLKNLLLLGAFGLVWPRVLSRCGLYTQARLRGGNGEWPRLLLAGAIGGAMAMVFPLTSQSGAVRPVHALLFAVAIAPAAAVLRETVWAAQRTRRGTRKPQIVIVGSGPLAAHLYCELQSDPFRADEVIGFVDSEPQPALRNWCGACTVLGRSKCRCHATGQTSPAHLGGVADLERILMHRVVDGVIVCLPIKSHYDEIPRALAACARVGVPVKYPADLFRRGLGVAFSDGRAAAPVFYVAVAPNDYRLLIKRCMDVAGALALVVLLAPLSDASPVLRDMGIASRATYSGISRRKWQPIDLPQPGIESHPRSLKPHATESPEFLFLHGWVPPGKY